MSLTEIKENIEIFKCPVCGKKVSLDAKSLICSDKHCFDISKKGYINLLLNAKKQNYDKELFISRDIICKMGFFDPLIELLVSLITSSTNNGRETIRILDAGCGEGFHLTQVIEFLNGKSEIDKNQASHTASESMVSGQGSGKSDYMNVNHRYKGLGIDISKEGIISASKKSKAIIWCVADLAKIPIMDKTIDIILNILSPSNYREFERLISENGILIKVVPGPSYLKELRQVFYEETDKENYSNARVIEHFERNFNRKETRHLKYSVKVNKDELRHLIKMTPLSWGVDEQKIEKVLEMSIDSITADFSIMMGIK